MSDYEHVIRGKGLSFKGRDGTAGKKKKKSSKSKKHSSGLVEANTVKQTISSDVTNALTSDEVDIDTRTETEKKFDMINQQREMERVKKKAEKTHRQKVEELNAYLENLSEHHDIPRVGPG